MNYDTAVIGGGPAGIFAAAMCASRGKRVCLIEKNKVLGKKLLITGKGRCNVTNSAPTEDFIANTLVNADFLYSAFYSFTNYDLMDLLSKEGLKLKTERGGRVFPQSDKASDVRDTLWGIARKNGVLKITAEVKGVAKLDDGSFKLSVSPAQNIIAKSVIIATGGVSYPQTGSTGDGYTFAKKLGHTIVEPKASLVPLVTKEKYVSCLAGLSLKNVSISIRKKGKEIYSDFGEMLFTHFGLSGPVILSSSSHINGDEHTISIDLKPALDFKALDMRVLRDFENEKNKDFINSLDALLPKKLIPVIVTLSGIDERKKVNSITKEERHRLVKLLKSLDFTIVSKRPVADAIVTSGGVEVKEINPATMQSKICEGLFFAGEVIDVDAYTGGFNLQIAFSTGYLAGMNA